MKKISSLCIALLFLIASCKKSNPGGPGYHLTATIDGTTQTFNVSPLAVIVNNSGYELISISGFSGSSSSAQTLALT